jgi:hypothetical protein
MTDSSVTVNNEIERIKVGKETVVLCSTDVITSVWSTDKRRHETQLAWRMSSPKLVQETCNMIVEEPTTISQHWSSNL